MWTLDYEADIASDLSAFHRIDDPDEIAGPRYFSLASRLTAYNGVMAARAYAETHRDDEPLSGARGAGTGTNRVADSTAIAMLEGEGWLDYSAEGA